MPHAASLQSFLDTCSQGRFDNSSNWLPQHPHCRHVVPQEHTGRHIAPSDPGAASCFPRSHKPLWLHVAGDSTMRFLYAALVHHFNGTCARPPCAKGFPLHSLPVGDPCSYARAGWSTNEKSSCFQRWRGRCWHPPCTLDARGPSGRDSHYQWRLTFEWLQVRRVERYNQSTSTDNVPITAERIRADMTSGSNGSALALFDWLQAAPTEVPTAVLVGAGVHEAVNGQGVVSRDTYEHKMRVGLNETAGRLAAMPLAHATMRPWVVLVGNGACRAAGITSPDRPSPP